MAKPWHCSHCNTHAVISDNDTYDSTFKLFDTSYLSAPVGLRIDAILCPNQACRKPTISIHFGSIKSSPKSIYSEKYCWKLMPSSSAMPLPEYIPQALRQDYEEACKIVDLSPKAAATLARRCLQGMIRNFWKIEGYKTLYDEIQAIKDEVDPNTWDAIDAIRGLGNIGAHMEQDINLIIPVEPDEAKLLIELIEDLFQTWYIQREERRIRAARVVEMAGEKKAAKNGTGTPDDEATAAAPPSPDGSGGAAG